MVARYVDRIKRRYWRFREAALELAGLPEYWAENLAARYVRPEIQKQIPLYAKRLKVTPETGIAIIITCGNRLELLQANLPSFLDQNYRNYSVIVSVYADKQGCARYLHENFPDHIRSGRLQIIETAAPTFNKARAANIAAAQCTSDYLFFIDVDCRFRDSEALSNLVGAFNFHDVHFASMLTTGQILVARNNFLSIGGYDVALGDEWAPDDADYICRHISHFQHRYMYLSERYTREVIPCDSRFRVRKRLVRHTHWLMHTGVRPDDFANRGHYEGRYYRRIGGPKRSAEEYLEATLNFFRENNAKIPFVALPPA